MTKVYFDKESNLKAVSSDLLHEHIWRWETQKDGLERYAKKLSKLGYDVSEVGGLSYYDIRQKLEREANKILYDGNDE